MDKGKSRNDHLAAGKKKLLQYRKKKDKGSGGGSSSDQVKSSSQKVEAIAEPEPDYTFVEQPPIDGAEVAVSLRLTDSAVVEQVDGELAVGGVAVSNLSSDRKEAQRMDVDWRNGEDIGAGVLNVKVIDVDEAPVDIEGRNIVQPSNAGEDIAVEESRVLPLEVAANTDGGSIVAEDERYGSHSGSAFMASLEEPAGSLDLIPVGDNNVDSHQIGNFAINNHFKGTSLESSEVTAVLGMPQNENLLASPQGIPNDTNADEPGEVTAMRESSIADETAEKEVVLSGNNDVEPQMVVLEGNLLHGVSDASKAEDFKQNSIVILHNLDGSTQRENAEPLVSSNGVLDSFQIRMYWTMISKDFLQLLLDEPISDPKQRVSESEEWKLVKEELWICKSQLQDAIQVKEELESQLASASEVIAATDYRCKKLQAELELAEKNMLHILDELSDCRSSLEILQKENSLASTSLVLMSEKKEQLEADREHLSSENEKLSAELIELNEKLSSAYHEHKQLETNIRESQAYFTQFVEQLLEESLCTGSIVEVYEASIKDLGNKCHVLLNARSEEIELLTLKMESLTREMNDIRQQKVEVETCSSSKVEFFEEAFHKCVGLLEKLTSAMFSKISDSHSHLADHCEFDENVERKEHHLLKFVLPNVEGLVALLLQWYQEFEEQTSLSETSLRAVKTSHSVNPEMAAVSVDTLSNLNDILDQCGLITSENIQLEIEREALVDSLKNMGVVLETYCSELHSKTSEIGQLEQKLSSVKEKLGIAVAKGKGLIVQRDNFKQGLAEKCAEADKLTKELQEMEAKLKSYSDADQIKSLESELSYVRKTATAMRDSFLLKDSILQRIEEVLEHIDLLQHGQGADVVEKVQLLYRLAIGRSTLGTDDEHRSLPIDTVSDLDAATMKISSDDEQNSFDELRIKYDNLQRKCINLAEHCNILEQSLVERNNIIYEWEDVLGEIFVPQHVRLIEPVDKVRWLGNRLSEVQQERDALQVKIEQLEDSSEMLITDLQESRKRIAELNWEVAAIKVEKDFFFESLEKSRHDFLGLSEKAVQDESDRDNLQKELTLSEKKLAEINSKICALVDLVHTVQPNDSEEVPHSDGALDYLGQSLTKLLDEQNASKKETLSEEKLAEIDTKICALVDFVHSVQPDDGEEVPHAGGAIDYLHQSLTKLVDKHNALHKEMTLSVEKLAEVDTKICALVDLAHTVQLETDDSEEVTHTGGGVNYLQRTLTKLLDKHHDLQKELTLSVEKRTEIDTKFSALLDLVHTVQPNDSEEVPHTGAAIDYLGQSFTKLVDKHNALRKELTLSEEKLAEINTKISSLVDLVHTVQPNDSEEVLRTGGAVDYLEQSLIKLLDKHNSLVSQSTRSIIVEDIHSDGKISSDGAATSERNVDGEFDEGSDSLAFIKQQRDEALDRARELESEIEVLRAQITTLQDERSHEMQQYQSLREERDKLQEQFSQEEQKGTSLKEKLNVAIRKGKGVVQQRDSLKQAMEDMTSTVERLKAEHSQHIEGLESEKRLLTDQLAETEQRLQDTMQYMSQLIPALHVIDVGTRNDLADPVSKVGEISNLISNLRAAVESSENESNRTKRALELLLNELNESQERVDVLQEQLARNEATLSEYSRQNDLLEAEKADIDRHWNEFYSQAREQQWNGLQELLSSINRLQKVFGEFSGHLADVFAGDINLIFQIEHFLNSLGDLTDSANIERLPTPLNKFQTFQKNNQAEFLLNGELKMDDVNDNTVVECLVVASRAVYDCVRDFDDLKRGISQHAFAIDQKAAHLSRMMAALQNRYSFLNRELESVKADAAGLHVKMKDKEMMLSSVQNDLHVLYEACSIAIAEIENSSSWTSHENACGPDTDDSQIKTMANKLVTVIKGVQVNSKGNNVQELRVAIAELQRELQEKDILISSISTDLSSQIKNAESFAKQLTVDLEKAKSETLSSKKQVEFLENENKALELKVSMVDNVEASSAELHGSVRSLTDDLSSKDQEIESLLQALNEQEKEIEYLQDQKAELEQKVRQLEYDLKTTEASRAKARAKLDVTVRRFEELHHFSECLIAEMEKVQLQLQERDSEISFLRQEVTRSTDELLALEEANKKHVSQTHDLVKWLEATLLRFGLHYLSSQESENAQILEYRDVLDKEIGSITAELDNLRVSIQSKESLLQSEKGKVEQLLRKSEVIEMALIDKDSQIGLLQQGQSSSRTVNSGALEIEPMKEKSSPGAVVTRGGRKLNSEHIGIAVESEHDDTAVADEDDDKSHGFKPLTMSSVVPKVSRPITDRIDGIWVSADRLLMRQPNLRIGVLIYWIALHAMLASFI